MFPALNSMKIQQETSTMTSIKMISAYTIGMAIGYAACLFAGIA